MQGLFPDDGKRYAAIVQRDNGDGTYLVAWLEDDNEYTLEAKDMTLTKRQQRALEYQAGDVVEGFFKEDETWYSGRIKRVLDSGSFIVVWDEGGEDYEIESKDLRRPTPKIPLNQLAPGQKLKGRVAKSLEFGSFIDIGAEREGLLGPFGQFEGATPNFKQGDKVKAIYDEDSNEYAATVKTANKDGTFDVVWDEDGNEYRCKPDKMTFMRAAELEVGAEVDVFVDRVYTDRNSNELRLSLVLYESKVGVRAPPRPQDLSGFIGLPATQWLKGKVVRLAQFGAFVEVTPPSGGKPTNGLVHVSQVKDGFVQNIEDELSVGQEVDVCVKNVDTANQRLSLSMVGC